MTKLSEIRKRLSEATPGPWAKIGREVRYCPPPLRGFVGRICDTDGESDSTVEFIANAPTDIAHLLATVEKMKAALELLVTDVKDYEAWQRPCHALNAARQTLQEIEE